MKRLTLALALPLVLVLLGCEGPISPTAPDETFVAQQPATGVGVTTGTSSAVAPGVNQAASAVISFPISLEIGAVNPCTGLDMIITVTGTGWWHAHKNNDVLRYKRTITTSDGFEGRGHETEVGNYAGASLYRATFNDMMTHPSGAKFRAHFVYLLDFGTSPPTVRVDKFAATCLGP